MTSSIDPSFEGQFTFYRRKHTILVIQELVEMLTHSSDYALTEEGIHNLEIRIVELHNKLPL